MASPGYLGRQSFQRHLERKKSRLSSNEGTPSTSKAATATADSSMMADDSFFTMTHEETDINIEALTRLETQHKEEVLGLKHALKRRESELIRIDDLLARLEERRGALQETKQPGKQPVSPRRTEEEATDLEEHLGECRQAREECLEELVALKNALDRRGNDLSEIIAQKDRQIHDLLGRLEESHCAREESLMELQNLKTSICRNDVVSSELERKEKEIKTLQAKLDESQPGRNQIAEELRTLKNQIGKQQGECSSTKEKQIQDLSAKLEEKDRVLEEKTEEVRQMRKKYGATIQKMETKMQDMADLNSKLYEEVEKSRKFEMEIERSRREKVRLSEQLVVVGKVVEEKSEKITQLDDLVKRLEGSLKNMDGERTSLLTTMASVIEKSAEMGSVTLLQQQLATTQSQLAQAQEQYTQAKDKVDLLEKKIEDTDKTMTELKIDLRIATRNLNRYEKLEQDEKNGIEKYQTEVCKLKEELATAEAKIKEMQNQQEKLDATVREKESEIEKNKAMLAEKANTCASTLQELTDTTEELKKANSSIDRYRTLDQTNEETQKNLKDNKQKLAEKDRKIKQLQNNIDLLKETCVVLETQLKEFEAAISAANSKVDAIATEKAGISTTLATTKEALRAANLQINEQKSLRIFNEKQIEQLKSRLNSEELEAHSQVTEINQQLARSTHTIQNYEEELSEIQSTCNQLEEELATYKNEVEHYKTLMSTSKLESSTFLMQIVRLKEANIALQNGFEESIARSEQLKANIAELNEKVTSLTAEKMDASLRFASVEQQQKKLIQHLQQQLEQVKSKKSRGIVDRLFNKHGEKSENTTPMPKTPSTPFGKMKTLETPLKRPDFTTASPAPAKILAEIQSVAKKLEVVADTRRREDCILLKDDEPPIVASSSSPIQRTLLYHEDTQLEINCCQFVQEGLYLIGCADGLYSVNLKAQAGQKTKIDGIDTVWAISFNFTKDFAVAIEGPGRNLSRINLGLLRACAEAAECSKPKISSTSILQISNAYMFKMTDSYIAVAGEKYLKIVQVKNQDFILLKNIPCPTNATSLLLTTQQTLLFGSDLVYEVDLLSGQKEEFMDSTDNSLRVNLANCSQFKQYPLAILDLTPKHASARKNSEQREYLVAFPDFGIFLDENGRRSRDMDIDWPKLPSCIEYHEPNLYIEHFTSIEILQLNANSFKKLKEPSVFVQMKTPRLLGSANTSGSMLVATTTKNLTEIYKINNPRTLHPAEGELVGEMDISWSSDEKYRQYDDTTSVGSTNTMSSF